MTWLVPCPADVSAMRDWAKVGRTPSSARDPLVALLREQAQWDETPASESP